MAEIRCEQCGYVNPEGVTVCEICAEPLVSAAPAAPAAPVEPVAAIPPQPVQTPAYVPPVQSAPAAPVETAEEIRCEQCGYLNPADATVCEICAETLRKAVPAAPAKPAYAPPVQAQPVYAPPVQSQPMNVPQTQPVYATTAQPAYVAPTQPAAPVSGVEYFVMCPESSTKTVVPSDQVTSYYCTGCQSEHFIDNIIWRVESRRLTPAAPTAAQVQPRGDNLWLEEINTHFRIDICKPGGTLGRYGTFGAEYFRSRGMNTVSGEHCLFRYELNNWVLSHISRTNQTMYDGMLMTANAPTLLQDGKMLTLANTVTFIVRIG